jgi:hypothetical protein
MRNFIQSGDMITVTAPGGGIEAGEGLQVGSLFGVAATTEDATRSRSRPTACSTWQRKPAPSSQLVMLSIGIPDRASSATWPALPIASALRLPPPAHRLRRCACV